MPQPPMLRPQHVAPVPSSVLASMLGIDAGERVVDATTDVTGITHDSRQVRPGDLYAALPGAVTHGARFTASALGAGAVAVVTDPAGAELAQAALANGSPADAGTVPVLVVPEPRARLGELAAQVYGHPARDLLLLGVTGTNGKTTTTYLLDAGLRAAGHVTGLIGTVETRVGDERVPSVRTTPESTDVHALLAVMRERGVTACAMEVSSHALVYGRVDGVRFDVAGFTNLTQDHLDFHRDLEDYFAAKAALFTAGRARTGVVCVDDDFGRRLAGPAEIPMVTVSARHAGSQSGSQSGSHAGSQSGSPAGDPSSADWQVESTRPAAGGGTTASLRHDATRLELQVPLAGEYNVANAALAVAMLAAAGVDPEVAAAGVARAPGVPGRMEQVSAGTEQGIGEPLALVDYAHTPDAIENVLGALRGRVQGRHRLIAVVGAGGDRDSHKRAAMGVAAARGADVVVVTDDNPRSEDPATIRAAVVAGALGVAAGERGEVVEVADRREAIRTAVAMARDAADTIAVLGKGHEQGQEIAGVVHPFDDREVLREELRRRSQNGVGAR